MFMRNNVTNKFPNLLKQLKATKFNCRKCQQSLAPRHSTQTEQPYLWSPEFLWMLKKEIRSENGRSSVQGNDQPLESSKMKQPEKVSIDWTESISNFLQRQSQSKSISTSGFKDATNILLSKERLEFRINNKCQKKKNFGRNTKLDQRGEKSARSKPMVCQKRRSRNSLHVFESQDQLKLFNSVQELKTNKVQSEDEFMLERIAGRMTDEWPLFFTSPVDFSLCSERLVFDNTILKIKTRGIRPYKFQAYLFKWITKSLWFDPSLRILQLTKHTEENSIRIRWQITGRPKILYPLELLGKTPSLRYLDYMSMLYIGEDEKIDVHRLINVVPTQRRQKRNPLLSLLALLGLSGTKMHIPSLQEEPVIPSSGGPS